MGFTMTTTNPNGVVQTYDHSYQRLSQIVLDLMGAFTDLALCLDETFLMGSHTTGKISVINLKTNTANIIDQPFFGSVGNVESIN